MTTLSLHDLRAGTRQGSVRWWQDASAKEIIRYRRARVAELRREAEVADRTHPDHWDYDGGRHGALIALVDRCDARLAEMGVGLPEGEEPTSVPKRGSDAWWAADTTSDDDRFAYRDELAAKLAALPYIPGDIVSLADVMAARVKLYQADSRLKHLGIVASFQEAAE